jgi:hypothetical protein
MVGQPRPCIFCGPREAGNRMSGEHLWSEWMADLLPASHGRKYIETRQTFGARKIAIAKPAFRKRQGTANKRRIKVVCMKCNSEWMGDLESANKHVLTPLILGKAGQLASVERERIAQWTALKVMVSEHDPELGHKPMPIFSQATRDVFKTNQKVPSGFKIWVGAGGSPTWEVGFYRFTGGARYSPRPLLPGEIPPHGSVPPNLHAITWGLGKLLFHIIASTDPNFDRIVWDAPGLVALWPLDGRIITWPPPFSFTDLGVNQIALSMESQSIWPDRF